MPSVSTVSPEGHRKDDHQIALCQRLLDLTKQVVTKSSSNKTTTKNNTRRTNRLLRYYGDRATLLHTLTQLQQQGRPLRTIGTFAKALGGCLLAPEKTTVRQH